MQRQVLLNLLLQWKAAMLWNSLCLGSASKPVLFILARISITVSRGLSSKPEIYGYMQVKTHMVWLSWFASLWCFYLIAHTVWACSSYECSNCWDQIPRSCHVFTRLFTSNTPWYFLDFTFILRAALLSSKLLGQGYVMERLKSSIRKFYGRYGDLIKHYEVSFSQMLHDILGHDHVQWHPQLIRHYTNLRTYYRTGLFLPILTLLPNFGGFLRTLQRVRLANRGRLLLRTPGPVPFGTCICSYVETILFWTCHVYGPFEFRTSLGTSILLWMKKISIIHTKSNTNV